MSEPKPAGEVVFRVVDKCGGPHFVTAVRMAVVHEVVTFYDVRGEKVGHFVEPIGVVLAESCTAFATSDLVPGEACVSSFQPAPRSLVFATCIVAAAFAVSVALKAYELFWFAG